MPELQQSDKSCAFLGLNFLAKLTIKAVLLENICLFVTEVTQPCAFLAQYKGARVTPCVMEAPSAASPSMRRSYEGQGVETWTAKRHWEINPAYLWMHGF